MDIQRKHRSERWMLIDELRWIHEANVQFCEENFDQHCIEKVEAFQRSTVHFIAIKSCVHRVGSKKCKPSGCVRDLQMIEYG